MSNKVSVQSLLNKYNMVINYKVAKSQGLGFLKPNFMLYDGDCGCAEITFNHFVETGAIVKK